MTKITYIEVIRDYITLSANILKQIDNHTPNSERYLIQKDSNCIQVIEILSQFAQINDNEAQVILGFLYQHGIIIPKNVKKATKYFKQSAKNGNARGNLFAYLKTDKPKYLFESCVNNYPNAINALGYESRYEKLSKKDMKFVL